MCSAVHGQKSSYTLEIESVGNPTELTVKYKSEHSDSISVIEELKQVVQNLHTKSYLLATIQKQNWTKNNVEAQIYIGSEYDWAQLKLGNISNDFAKKMGFKEKFFRGQPVRPDEFFDMEYKLIQYAANNGYPFAKVSLDSATASNKKIKGVLNFIKGPKITFDTLQIIGGSSINRKFPSKLSSNKTRCPL